MQVNVKDWHFCINTTRSDAGNGGFGAGNGRIVSALFYRVRCWHIRVIVWWFLRIVVLFQLVIQMNQVLFAGFWMKKMPASMAGMQSAGGIGRPGSLTIKWWFFAFRVLLAVMPVLNPAGWFSTSGIKACRDRPNTARHFPYGGNPADCRRIPSELFRSAVWILL